MLISRTCREFMGSRQRSVEFILSEPLKSKRPSNIFNANSSGALVSSWLRNSEISRSVGSHQHLASIESYCLHSTFPIIAARRSLTSVYNYIGTSLINHNYSYLSIDYILIKLLQCKEDKKFLLEKAEFFLYRMSTFVHEFHGLFDGFSS